LFASISQRTHDAPAIDIRQHDIQDHQIVGLAHGQVVSVQSVTRQIHDEPCLHETLADVIRRLVLVFNDQQLHRMPHEIAAA
jgi:hypothetical protein